MADASSSLFATANVEMKKTRSFSSNEKESLIKRMFSKMISLIHALFFSVVYATADTRKRFVSFFIGLVTVIIVVFVVSVLYNSITKAPVIFMKLAEDTVGEADLTFSARFTNTSTQPFLNFTELAYKLEDSPITREVIAGITPRWMLFGSLRNSEDYNKNTSAIFLIIDTEREESLKLGRTWPYRPLGRSEIHVRDALLRALDVRKNRGEKIDVVFDLMSLLGILSGRSQSISQNVDPGSGGFPTFPTGNSTEMVKFLLQSLGINLNQTYTVNVTEIAHRLDIDIPEFIIRIIAPDGTITVTGEQLVDIAAALLNAFGGLNDALSAEYTVVDSVDYSYGKYPSALGNVAILDSRFLMRAFKDSFLSNAGLKLILELFGALKTFEEGFDNFKLEEYAVSIVGLYKNRYTCYLKSEKELDKEMIALTNSIVDVLGVDFPINIQLPLVQALAATKFISLFLDQIFVGVVVMLGVLGVILIFALLLSNVEEKTYEFGMLRALGMKQNSLIAVILIQSAFFAIPGIIIAMILSVVVNAGVEFAIGSYVSFPFEKLNFTLNWVAVVVPIALGIFIPLISNIIPIQRAMSRTLRDSLDITHQTFNETTVRMIKLAQLGLEPWQTALSIILVIIGFVVYYVIPYSFIFQDLPLFFFILNGILLGMLFGLCMIAVVIQPFFEKLVLNLILWGPDRRLKTLIYKNLAGHRKRSRKTFLMFVLSVAFIIFSGVVFALQSSNIVQNVELLVGADVTVESFVPSYPLPEKRLNEFLDREIERKDGCVIAYSYLTFEMRRLNYIGDSRFSSLAYYPTRRVKVVGVTRNFLHVAYSRYFLYTQVDGDMQYNYLPNGKPDVIDSLYKDAGKAVVHGERPGFYPHISFSGREIGKTINDTLNFDPSEKYKTYLDVIISEAMRDEVSVNVKSPMQIKFNTRNPQQNRYSSQDYIAKARAMVYKMPGFFYSSYRLAAQGSPVLITLDTFEKVSKQSAESVKYGIDEEDLVPKAKLLIQFKPDTNSTTRADLMNAVRSFLDPDFTQINDVLDVVASTGTATNVLMGFFNVVAVIAVVLCFFILMISFTSNVRENSWEFGVLRSIGLSVNKLIRAYIYEALSLVVSAFICGTVIGVVIALTLTAQFNLFLEMPFQFAFPWILFVSIGIMAIIVAVVGSYLPARQLKKKEIAFVLRGLE